MNINPVISLPVAADLSAYSHVAVKLTSTGIDLAGSGDRTIGTMTRGNSVAANTGDTVIGRAAAVQLNAGTGLHFITIANNTAIAMADELELWPNGRYAKRGSTLSVTGADTGDVITAAGHGFSNGTALTPVAATSGAGYTINTTLYVVAATTNTFQLSATSGGAAVAITTDYVGLLLQPANLGAVAGIAVDSAPSGSIAGQINAILLSGGGTGSGSAGAAVLTAATTLTAADSGKTFFLSLAGGFTVTLPAPALGIRYKFIVQIAPTTAYIISAATADTIVGKTVVSETAVANTNVLADSFNFIASSAVAGDTVIFESDGLLWYAYGILGLAASGTFSG